MIYLVSGWARTGTSMMMEALEAGGLEAAYDTAKDEKFAEKMLRTRGTVPNRKYYEFERPKYREPGFPAQYDGKLIKGLYGAIPRLNAGLQYRVIYMRRPQNQIVTSLHSDLGPNAVGNASRPNFVSKQEKAIQWMLSRPGQFLSVKQIWYHQVLADPLGVFERLAQDGWPIDPAKAAVIPDKGRSRHSEPIA